MGILKQTAVKSALAASVFLMASPAFAASGKELINQGLELVGWMVWVVVAVAVAYGAWTTFFAFIDLKNMFNNKHQGPKASGSSVAISFVVGICCLCLGGYLGWAKATFESSTNNIGVGTTVDSDSFKLK